VSTEPGQLEGTGSAPFAFSPFPWTAVVRDTLVYTDGLGGEIVFFDPNGVSGRSRSFTVPGRDLSLRAAWAQLEGVIDVRSTGANHQDHQDNRPLDWDCTPLRQDVR